LASSFAVRPKWHRLITPIASSKSSFAAKLRGDSLSQKPFKPSELAKKWERIPEGLRTTIPPDFIYIKKRKETFKSIAKQLYFEVVNYKIDILNFIEDKIDS
ncbi:18567_t:CDS:2, partial [Racocetra fulgida]